MFRSSAIIFAIVSMSIGVILFKVKYEVVGLESHHHKIKKSIHEVKESIHILKAEWAHLANPERIQKLSIKYLPEGKVLLDKKNKNNRQINNKKEIKVEKESIDQNPTVKDAIDLMLDESIASTKLIRSTGVVN